MRWARSVLLAGCAMQATTSVAAREVPTVTSVKLHGDEATKLARLIYPEALNRAITTYTIIHVVTPAYHADLGLQSLEAEYPGIIDAMIAAMRPAFEQGRVDALPALWSKTGAVYAANLSPDEIRETIAFYASPTGQRRSLAEREAIANASSPSAEGPAGSYEDWNSKPDEVPLTRPLISTALSQRLAALQPQIDAIIAVWSKAPTPQVDARVSATLAKVVARYRRSAPPPVHQRPAGPPEPSAALTK